VMKDLDYIKTFILNYFPSFFTFQNDLDRFSEKLLVLLKEVKKGSLSQEVLQDYLKGWYTYTVSKSLVKQFTPLS
jgi:hypothetical protein